MHVGACDSSAENETESTRACPGSRGTTPFTISPSRKENEIDVVASPLIRALSMTSTSWCAAVWNCRSGTNRTHSFGAYGYRTNRSHVGPFFGWLQSHIRVYPETVGLKTRVHLRNGQDSTIHRARADRSPSRD